MQLEEIPPYVGMPATVYVGSDRFAATVLFASAKFHKVIVQEDISTRIDTNGPSETQVYTFAPNPGGRVLVFHKGGNNYAIRGMSLYLGARRTYHDYSF